MATILRQIIYFVTALLRLIGPGGLRSTAAEMALLRHQLQVVTRQQKRAPRLCAVDRFVMAFTSLLINSRRLARAAIVIKPATLLAFHRALVRRKYSILYGRKDHKKPGPKGPSPELIQLVLALKTANPRFGYGKISLMATRALGLAVDEDIVRRILQKHYLPTPGDGPSWLTFIGHAADSLWSLDLFRCESVLLGSYWVMLVMDQFSRKIKGFSVHSGPLDGPSVCRMFVQSCIGLEMPKHLSTDHDPLFTYHQWVANLRILRIDEIKSIPHTPTSHPFIERLIGTVRRELLDNVLFWNTYDLENKLQEFVTYFNEHRVHYALTDARTPAETSTGQPNPKPLDLKRLAWRTHCRGMFITPIAA